MKALVTGAETPEGLAVIRALGRAGVTTISAGDRRLAIGFASRFPSGRYRYTPVAESPRRFVEDLCAIIDRTEPDLVIPIGEDLLVTVNEARHRVARRAILASPPPEVLARALDRVRTLTLVKRLGINTPRWVQADSLSELLEAAGTLRFPVAVRPRGPALHRATAHTLDFAVEYAESIAGLAKLLAPRQRDIRMVIVQECVTGIGHCVTAVADQGRTLTLFPCEWERELPLTGGVSVVRRSIPLDPRLAEATTRILEAWGWHGVAMVEFRYDRRDDEYTFMGVAPRFPASVALALEAGINLPYLAACLHGESRLPELGPHRIGVRERWLRGDLLALRDALARPRPRAPLSVPFSRATAPTLWWTFLKDLLRGAWSSEFHFADPGPAVVELGALGATVGGWFWETVGALARSLVSKRQVPFAVEPREEDVVALGLEIREEVGVSSFQQDPGPGSGEFALSNGER